MLETHVFMHITGKISEGNLIYLSMNVNSALNGKPSILFKPMQTDAAMNIGANIPMDGKSKNIILTTTRCTLAGKESPVQNLTVLTFTRTLTKEIQSALFSNSSREIVGAHLEAHTTPSINSINQFF